MSNESQNQPNLIEVGVVAGVMPTEQKGNWNVRKIVLDKSWYNNNTGELKEDYHPWQFFGDKCSDLDGIEKGDKVKITFSIKGGKKNGKFEYLNVNPYKIEVLEKSNGNGQPTTVHQKPKPVAETVPSVEEMSDYDDLPF